MPQILSRRDVCPPDGFRYTHRETGHTSTAMDWFTWQDKIREHRKANNLPVISEADADAQLCLQLAPEWCAHSENNRSWVNTRLSFGDIAAGVLAYARLALSGFKTVEQSEANRRARICAGCYLLVAPQGCGVCSQMANLITGDVAQKKTDYDAALGMKACAACRCPVKSLVHFPMEELDRADDANKQEAFADFCWRKLGGENRLPA